MKIGFDITSLNNSDRSRAGFDSYLFGLLGGLQQVEPRPDVRLFVCSSRGRPLDRASFAAMLRSHGIDFPLRDYRKPHGPPYRLREAWGWLRSGLFRLDVFQSIACLDFPDRGRALRAFLIPDLSTIRRPEDHTPHNVELWRSICERARVAADLIVTFSEQTAREVRGEFGIPPDRIAAIPLGIGEEFAPRPPADLEAALRPHDLVPGQYLLTVGTLEPRKNHLGLFRAYAEALRGDFPPWPLAVIGPTGWNCEEILAEPARLGIADRVRFLGRQEALAAFYGGAAAFIYPSFYEGFGLPPLEAMACGTPVACSNATSLPEIVGDAALTFDPNDVAAITAALRTLANDPELREQLRKRGSERARKYRWIDTARGYLAAYESARRRLHARG